MFSLFSLLNKLEKIQNTVGWEDSFLPHVVVIGTQGSGKTSVLESIIGHYIFPHFEGLSTKCPVILHLRKSDSETFITFKHIPNKRFYDWQEVQCVVKEETEKCAAVQYGIDSKPIFMEFQSPNFADLTLVDLPGFAEVASQDQPVDISKQLKKMAMQYIRSPNTVILAVTPATTDMATNECLMLSRLVDDSGKRTIVVVTKLDLAGPGADMTTTLKGQEVAGFPRIVGMVCRPQKMYKEKRKMEDVLKQEKKLLLSKYSKIASDHGTGRLQAHLASVLHAHVKNRLPHFRDHVNSCIRSAEAELTSLGSSSPESGKVVLEEVTRYANAYCSLLTGNTIEIETDALVGGARICHIFQDVFGYQLDSVQALSGLTRSQVMTALLNTCGTRPDVQFIPESCFENLARRQVLTLAPYCRECVDLVYSEMLRMIRDSTKSLYTDRYPRLYDVIFTSTADLIERGRQTSAKLVEELVEMELSYINTLDSDFQRDLEACKIQWLVTRGVHVSGGVRNIPKKVCIGNPQGNSWFGSFLKKGEDEGDSGTVPSAPNADEGLLRISPKEDADCELVENLITSYIVAVKRSLKGGIPKAIMLRLVSYVHNNLYHTLLDNVQQRQKSDPNLLQEPEYVAKKRKDIQFTLKELEDAESIISSIQDLPYAIPI